MVGVGFVCRRQHLCGEALATIISGCDSEMVGNAWLQLHGERVLANVFAIVKTAMSDSRIYVVATGMSAAFQTIVNGLPTQTHLVLSDKLYMEMIGGKRLNGIVVVVHSRHMA